MLGREIVPTKLSFSGDIVTLAPESHITGNAASGAIIDRTRLGARSATLSGRLREFLAAMLTSGRRIP